MKEWDLSQNLGKESAKQELLLTHPIAIGEFAFFYMWYIFTLVFQIIVDLYSFIFMF